MGKLTGYCRLCGELKELSKEHIPPKSAFNNHGVVYESMKDALGISGKTYSKSPNGIKEQTLCENCNKLTGDWYARDFVEWSRQGYEYLYKLTLHDILYLPFYIKPLNVIKQTIIMSLAVLDEPRIIHYEYLRRFILNKEQKYLPDDVRVYVYFTNAKKPRFSNTELVISRVDVGATDYVNAEIALPPFGYCITSTRSKATKSLAQHFDLYDITWFSNFDYNVWSIEHLKLPKKEVNSPFPLDYRTKDEVETDFASSRG